MKINKYIFLLLFAVILGGPVAMGQDTVRYTGNTLSNVDYHHGQLASAIGVHNIQVVRANREHPEQGDGFGWTYNHAPMLAYWNNQFYLEYLSDSVGEHIPPGQTLLMTSDDGYHWDKPTVLFPLYQVPDGTTKEGVPDTAHDLTAVMHQRVGFYVSKSNRLLAMAYYGISLNEHDSPNDGNGIGRAIREIKKDGSFGPIYFIRYNHGWNAKNTNFPFYQESKDKAFVEACEELLDNPIMMQQWVEEADRDDPLIPLQEQYKAFSPYHLQDGRLVGLWKHALTSISDDDGKSWKYAPARAPGFVNSNAKIWGQATSDGRFATVYNPSEFRWPLAISTSDDGLNYEHLWLVQGEITSMRYGGNYKSYGPQYVRGILEGNGTPPDGKMWVTYSMNKEDIWLSGIPVPVTATETKHVNDIFNDMSDGSEMDRWNIYSPIWAQATIHANSRHEKVLRLSDKDPFDYARVERVIPASEDLEASFTIMPKQQDHGQLQIEFLNPEGNPAIRIIFDAKGQLKVKSGYRFSNLLSYKKDSLYQIDVKLNTERRYYEVFVNGKKVTGRMFFAPAHVIQRIAFRTGDTRRFPHADTPTDQMFDLPNAGEMEEEAIFDLYGLETHVPEIQTP